MELDKDILKMQAPFTAMISGPTGSGKSYLVRDILKHYKILTTIDDVPLRVSYCYGQWQELFKIKVGGVDIRYNDGLIGESEIKQIKPHVIIIDDLMGELSANKDMSSLFTKGSHHLNVSVIFIVQNIFHQGKEFRTISLNCHYIIILKSPRDELQIMNLGRQIFPTRQEYFIQAYKTATNTKYGFLFIDLKGTTGDDHRLRCNLIPPKALKDYAPMFLLPPR